MLIRCRSSKLISTHAPRVRRDTLKPRIMFRCIISTHAPRVRRDPFFQLFQRVHAFISTHAPRVRRDRNDAIPYYKVGISTHAPRVRRDTRTLSGIYAISISTHAPRVRRDVIFLDEATQLSISTHAPRVRRDGVNNGRKKNVFDFYSRASCEARLKRLFIDKQYKPFLLTRLV